MTFDKVSLDLNGLFVDGQLYVALSRVRSLDGLFLKKDVIPQYAHTNSEIITYSRGYNDERFINNEIESGKAVYDALRHNDYDEAARQYLMLIIKKVQVGDIKEAMQQAKRFLDTVVCDDGLMNSVESVPEDLLQADHWASKFLAALLSLYAGQYEQALMEADEVLAKHECREALYVKSRALAMLGRYHEADEVNVLLGETMDLTMPDAKVLYMVAMLNEMYIGDPGLGIMRHLIEARPKYDRGIHAMRMLMKRNSIRLDSPDESELIDAFNSDLSEDEFDVQLKECRKNAPKAVSYLIQRIKKQEFE